MFLLLIKNKYVQIAIAFVVVLIALTAWKYNLINNYEDKKQIEVKEQVIDDGKKIQDTFSESSDAINDSVNWMLTERQENRLRSIGSNPCDAYRVIEGNIDMGAQDGLLYIRTFDESKESELLQGLNPCSDCK